MTVLKSENQRLGDLSQGGFTSLPFLCCIGSLMLSVYAVSAFSVEKKELCPSICGESGRADETKEEDEHASLSLYIDNDGFASATRDEDYTGAIGLALTGSLATEHLFSLDGAVSLIDKALGRDQQDFTLHSFEAGMMAFTPDDIKAKEAILDDRPYASLLFISNTQHHVNLARRIDWVSSLSFGFIGLTSVGKLQNGYHKGVGASRAAGWDYQISEGGEPTLRYSLVRQQYYDLENQYLQVTAVAGGSVGYITEAIYGVGFRAGKIRTPWWHFNINNSSYGEKANMTYARSNAVDELYFMAGVNIKLRAYNVFLQGQFRDSVVEYAASDIEPLVYEGWMGFASQFMSGFRLSYVLKYQTSEVKHGLADHSVGYGELITTFKF